MYAPLAARGAEGRRNPHETFARPSGMETALQRAPKDPRLVSRGMAPPPGFEFPGIPLPGPTGVCGARLNSISPRGDRRYTGLSYGGDEAHYGGLYVFFADVQPVPESRA